MEMKGPPGASRSRAPGAVRPLKATEGIGEKRKITTERRRRPPSTARYGACPYLPFARSREDDLAFADALRRRLEPAWPFAEALRLLAIGLAGLCDAALDIWERRSRRCFEEKNYFFFFFAFLAFFAFFAFFAMLPS
jgi:hypothetical protein